jgi:tetratricopeptide (TPR) repeat protein
MANKIKALLQEAELFRKQGLLGDARRRYEQVGKLITSIDKLPNKQKLLNGLDQKIADLDEDVKAVENAPSTPEMSSHVNELIKKLFAFSEKEKNEDDAALEGAIALAKFGQFDGALEEFHKLLQIESVRVASAKNILRCHLEKENVDEAFTQLAQWQGSEMFNEDQFEKVNAFFTDILDKKGLAQEEASPDEVDAETTSAEEDEEEFLDISAVAITFDSGPSQGEQIELDVSFQSGNVISLIISSTDEHLIESLKVGVRLDDVHFYSPVAIFRGAGVVSAKTEIKSGPKKGDYSVDIKIESL